jgi:hypothetical protein
MDQSNQKRDMAQHHIARYSALKSQRGNFESLWNDIARVAIPDDKDTFSSLRQTQGEKRMQEIYDSTATVALMRFVALFDSLLTPHSGRWHTLTTSNEYLNRSTAVRKYFQQVEDTLFRERYNPAANFVHQNQSVWMSLGGYGTGSIFIDHLWGRRGLRYRFCHLGEMFHSDNHQGIADTFYRYFNLTARQALQQFPDTLPDSIKEKANNPASAEEKFEFLHCVYPNPEYNPRRLDGAALKFKSQYISITGQAILEEGGYRTAPYVVSHFMRFQNELYGRGPIGSVLPGVKTLQEQKRQILEQGHRALNPIYLVHDDGVLNTMSARPGTILAGGVSPEGRSLVQALPPGSIQTGEHIAEQEKILINDSLFISLFQILNDTPEMTAFEVMHRMQEKATLLAPPIGRQEAYLAQVIDREMDILSQQRLLPPMPPELKEARGEYIVRYNSPLAKMRETGKVAGLLRVMDQVLKVANVTQSPESLMYFNMDKIVPEVAEIEGLPVDWIRTVDEVQNIRQSQAESQQLQQMSEVAKSSAPLIKALNG